MALDRKQNSKLERFIDVLEEGDSTKGLSKEKQPLARILQLNAQAWLGDESIQGVSVGTKITEGVDSGSPCITVYVDKKRPLHKLSHPVPTTLTLDETVEFDVVEIGKMELQDYRGPRRPLHPGACLANMNRNGGTLGAFVRHRDFPNRVFLISNHHVLAPLGSNRRDIIQPSKDYGGDEEDIVARYLRSFPMNASRSSFSNLADAAIAEIKLPTEIQLNYPELGQIKGVSGRVVTGQKVHMVGSHSGLSKGKIINTNYRMAQRYRSPNGPRRVGFRKQVLCTRYSQPGDSGALIINNRGFAIGMHVAGNDSHSVFCRLMPILKEFDCRLLRSDESDVMMENLPSKEETYVDDMTFTLADELLTAHQQFDSVYWKLTPKGIEVDGKVEYTAGEPVTVTRIWNENRQWIMAASERFQVPSELIIACICTETQGNAQAIREEPGYVSDDVTPQKISAGLMQTLISTAQETLADLDLDRNWLLQPQNSINAGTAYIKQQLAQTQFDPPKVACAYNAGGIYQNRGRSNRWRMRQFPIGTGKHADRFVLWFNDCFRFFAAQSEVNVTSPSFYRQLNLGI